jgi:hypothetical protein
MIKVYFAGSYDIRKGLRQIRDKIKSAYIEVTSEWIDYDFEAADAPESREHYAHVDVEDILEASILVLFVSTASTSGGMWTEFGFALGRKIPVIVVGYQGVEVPNPFLELAVARVDSREELVEAIHKVDQGMILPL